MKTRICSKCHIEKPLTLEFYGIANKDNGRMHTECRVCKKAYLKQYQTNKRLSKDPEEDRMKELYTIKEVTKEELNQRLMTAYAHIYNEAYGSSLTLEELERLID